MALTSSASAQLGWFNRQASRHARQDGVHPLGLIAASCLWLATVANAPLWLELRRLALLETAQDWAFAAALTVIIATTLAALLSLLAWRATLKPALALLFVLSSIACYFMLSYGVVMDSGMVANVLQTDWQEARDLFSLPLLLWLALLGLLPALVVWRLPLSYGRWRQRLAQNFALLLASLLLIAIAVVASFQPLSSNMRNHKQLRYLINPLNVLYASAHAAIAPMRRPDSGLEPIGLDARLALPKQDTGRVPLLVLVLGETARSANFGLNGYARDTTPELAALDLASFRQVTSCGTSTAASVPCMFSHLGRTDFAQRKGSYEGLLDLVQRSGMAVLWVDNQAGCKGVCDRVPTASTSGVNDPRWCTAGECLDMVLLEGLEKRLDALPAERRARGIVVVLHQMGSHGPAYFKRSPAAFKRFLPECQNNQLQRCERAEVVNAYDNSIAYTDHFLAATIGWLKQRAASHDTALIYVSDHGESLGENNLYLHGLPIAIAPEEQTRVPWITWLSGGFQLRSGVRTDCLRKQTNARLSHDHYFHSVLGLLGIQTAVYRQALDAYASCASL